MEQTPDPAETANRCTHEGKFSKKIDVTQECVGESFGGAGMLLPRPGHHGLQVS